jgi:TonB-linked SusC/RagA family outer membrane protein
MDAAEFKAYGDLWSKNSGRAIPNPDRIFLGGDTNWQDEIMGQAFSQNHNLNFSGGNDYTRYYFALGYLNQDGVVKNSNFERYSLRANMNNFLSKTVSIQTTIFGNQGIQNGVVPAQNNNTFSVSKTAIGSSLWAIPTIPIRDASGKYNPINDFVENPVLYVNEVLDRSTVNKWLGSTTIKVNILNGLSNNTRVGIDYTNLRKDLYFPRTLQFLLGGNGAAILQNRENLNYVIEDFLEYKNRIANQFTVEGILGASIQRETTKFSNIEGTTFISDDLQNNAIQAAQTTAIPTTNETQQSIASLFGRIRFLFQDKYILAASIRRDGASVFSATNKIATFPSVSFAWKLHQENFLKGIQQISTLKLRASWGESGNPAIQPYQSLPLGVLLSTSQGAGTGLAVGLAPNLPNPNLTWETTTQTNAGLDFGFFNNRITGTFDYYLKKTAGALTTVQLAPSAGFNTIIDNTGEVENQGFELSMNTILVNKENFDFSIGFNVSNNQNKVTKTKNNQDIIETLSSSNGGGDIYSAIRVGEELGSFYGYKFTGFDDRGVPKYQDVNNDGKLDASDFLIIGSPFPDLLYGFNAAVNYKNISLTAYFQGVSGNQVYNVMQYFLTDPNDVDANRMANLYDYYPNPNVNLVHRSSDRYLEDASYFRLRTVRLAYNLPIRKSLVKGIDFYLSGQNLFTITDYTGYDPEVNSLNGNTLTQGVDLSAYPSTKSYTFGLNVKF